MKLLVTNILISLLTINLSGQNYIQKIFPDDPATGVFFGRFLGLSSQYAVISAYLDFENGANSGSIYVFKKEDNKFVQDKKLFPEDGKIENYFGYSVGIYDDWIIAGSHHDSDFGASSGSAFMLKNNGDNWDFYQKLLPPDPAEADEFGNTVDIYGDFAISCAYLDDDNGTNSGSVSIFKFDGNNWNFYQKISPANPQAYSQFGVTLDIYKDKIIIGAPFKNDSQNATGCAYIFELENDNWIEKAELCPEFLNLNDQFSYFVKISDNEAFISSIKDDEKAQNAGAVYIYERNEDSKWEFGQKIMAPDAQEGDAFGSAIDIQDSLLFIGAYFDDDNGSNSGSMYIYKKTNGYWYFLIKVVPTDSDQSDAFGASISVSGDDLLVGAYSDDDNGFFSGAAYLFSVGDILNSVSTIENNINLYNIFPTIAQDFIFANNEHEIFSYVIYDLNGHFIKKEENSTSSGIDISNLKQGMYVIRILDENKSTNYKFIKI